MQVETLEVGVLVNNVGMSYPHAEYYDAIDDQLIDDLITMNIVSTNKACCGVNELSHCRTLLHAAFRSACSPRMQSPLIVCLPARYGLRQVCVLP